MIELEEVGLSKQEAKTYLGLLELREAKTGPLCEKTRIHSSNIYPILESLIKKGLVNYQIKNNIKIYSASNPESLKQILKEKEEKFKQQKESIENLIIDLKKRSVQTDNQEYKYFEGISGVKSLWEEINNLLPTLDKNIIIKIYTGKTESYERLIGFYLEHHKLRKKYNIHAQMIFPLEDKNAKKERENTITKIKLTKMENLAEWGVVGDYLFIQHIYGKNPHGFLIKDSLFAQTFEIVFDKIWKEIK